MTTTTLSNGQTLINTSILAGNTDLETSSSTIYVVGTLHDAGTLTLTAYDPSLLILDSSTISVASGGVISLSNSGGNEIYGASGTRDALINAKGTIEGGGQIGSGTAASLTLNNEAGSVIDADQSGASLTINTGSIAVINNGLMEATGAAGLTITDSAIDNNGGTLLASGGGDNIYLAAGADIVGGPLSGASGGSFQVTGNATLDGSASMVTIDAATTVQIDGSQELNIFGTLDDLGTLTLTAYDPSLLILDSSTISVASGGVISLSNSGGNEIYGASGTRDALINAKGTIEGGGQIGSGTAASLTLNNEAGSVIDADQSGASLTINTGSIAVINNGLMEATGAAGLTITDSAIDNNGGTLLASGGGDNIYLAAGADIVGGPLSGASGGSFQVTGNATLDGSASMVTIDAATTVQIDGSQELNIFGTLDDLGTLTLTAYDPSLLILDSSTISVASGGVISLSNSGGNEIYGASGTRDALINAKGIIEGGGQIGSGTAASLTLNNEAGSVIDADQSGASLTINTGSIAVINNGLMEATGAAGLTITDSAIDNNGGTLLASGGGDNIYLAAGADIVGGPLSGASGGSFQVTGNATLDGSASMVTIDAATTVQIDGSQELNIFGTLDDLGTLTLTAYDPSLLILDSSTISVASGGVISLSNSGGNEIYGASGTRDALINAKGIIEGGGQIGSGTAASLTLNNEAGSVIDADQSGASLTINTGSIAVINNGLMEATGAAGLTITDSAIDNNGGTLLASGGGDNIYLAAGADIVGGPLSGASGGSFQVTGNATLDGSASMVTIDAATTVQIDGSQELNVFGTLDDLGTLTLTAYDPSLLILDSSTISVASGGVISLSNSGGNEIYGASGTRDALINAKGIIEGGGQIGSGTAASLTLNNEAGSVIDADQSGASLTINTGSIAVINNGLMEATGAAGLTITDSAIDNNGGTLLASGGGDNIYLAAGADIVGGPLSGASGGSFQVTGNATLDGSASMVTIDAATTVQIDGSQELNIFGTLDDLGTLTLTAYDPSLLILDSSTISVASGGVISLSNSGGNEIYGASGTRDALINAKGTIEGGGQIGSGTATSLTLNNEAGSVIDADQSGASLTINTGSIAVINNGLMEATGAAGLTIASNMTNNGHILAMAGTSVVAGNVSGSGSFTIGSGASLELGGTSTETTLFKGNTSQGSILILEEPAKYTGKLASLSAGDTLDIIGSTATSAEVSASHLIITLTDGGVLSYALTTPQSGIEAATSTNGNGGTDINISTGTTSKAASASFAQSDATQSQSEGALSSRTRTDFPVNADLGTDRTLWTGSAMALHETAAATSMRFLPPTKDLETTALPVQCTGSPLTGSLANLPEALSIGKAFAASFELLTRSSTSVQENQTTSFGAGYLIQTSPSASETITRHMHFNSHFGIGQ